MWGKRVSDVTCPADTDHQAHPTTGEKSHDSIAGTSAGRRQRIHAHRVDGGRLDHRHLVGNRDPEFLGAQNKAKDRSAQSSARNALTNAKTIYADSATYATATPAALLASGVPTFQSTISIGPKNVSVADVPVKDLWFGAVLSDTDTCFYIADNLGAATATLPAGTSYAKGAAADCTVAKASAVNYITGKW